jgi:hypothetical protein
MQFLECCLYVHFNRFYSYSVFKSSSITGQLLGEYEHSSSKNGWPEHKICILLENGCKDFIYISQIYGDRHYISNCIGGIFMRTMVCPLYENGDCKKINFKILKDLQVSAPFNTKK